MGFSDFSIGLKKRDDPLEQEKRLSRIKGMVLDITTDMGLDVQADELPSLKQWRPTTNFDYAKADKEYYDRAREKAEAEYYENVSSIEDRNELTKKYIQYTQAAGNSTDIEDYYKNNIVAGMTEQKLSNMSNLGTKIADRGEALFQGARNTVAGIEDTLYKTKLDLDYLTQQADDDYSAARIDSNFLYKMATRNAGTAINMDETAAITTGLKALAKVIAENPENEDAQRLFNVVVSGGYTGDYNEIKELADKVKDFAKNKEYDKFRNQYTIGAKNDDQLSTIRAGLSYDGWDRDVLGAYKTAGGMIPAIGASLATGGAAGALGYGAEAAGAASTAASLTTMGLGAYGQSFNEARDSGNDWTRSSIYATLSAATEVGTELIGGETVNSLLFGHAVSTPAGKFAKDLIENKLHLSNALAKGAVATLLDIHAEGVEEVLSQMLDPFFRATVLQDEHAFDDYAESLFQAYWDSILPTIMLGAGGFAANVNEVSKYKNYMSDAIKNSVSLTDEQKGKMLAELDKVTAEAKAGFTENYLELKETLSKSLDEADLGNIDTLMYAVSTLNDEKLTEEEKTAKIQEYANTHGGVFNESQATSQELKDKSATNKITYNDMDKINKAVEEFKNETGAEINTAEDINGVQKSIKDLLERLTGKQVVFANIKSDNSKYYGFMKDDGNIYINSSLNTKDTMSAANHELGHYLKMIDENLYKEFLRLSGLDQNSKRVRRTIREYKARVNSNLTNEEAKIEMFGDYVGEIMSKYRNTKAVEQDVSTILDNLKNIMGKINNAVTGKQRQGNVSEYNLEGTSYLEGDILQDYEFEKKVLNAFKELKQEGNQTKKATKKVFKPKETTSQKDNSVDNDVKKRIEDKYKSLNKKLTNVKNVKEMIANELGVDYNDEKVDRVYKDLKNYGEIGERIRLSAKKHAPGKLKRNQSLLKGDIYEPFENGYEQDAQQQNTSALLKHSELDQYINADPEKEKYLRYTTYEDFYKTFTSEQMDRIIRDGNEKAALAAAQNKKVELFRSEGNFFVLELIEDRNVPKNIELTKDEIDYRLMDGFLGVNANARTNMQKLVDDINRQGMGYRRNDNNISKRGVAARNEKALRKRDNYGGRDNVQNIRNDVKKSERKYTSKEVEPKANVTAQGTTIPWGLVKWASRSEARESNGQLDEFYHGSPFAKDDTFDQFKPRYAHNGATLGDGYYLTRSYNRALNYTDMENREDVNADDYVKTFIVNTLNPLDITEPKKVKAQILRNFDSMIEKFNPGFSGGQNVFNKWGRVPYTEDMKEMLEEDSDDDEWFKKFVEYFVPQLAKVNYTNEYGVEETEYIDTREIYKYLGFDSIMDYSDIVIFESNQAKYLDNANPTTDSRFAYSTRKDKNDNSINYANVKDEVEKYANNLKIDDGYRITVEKGKGLENIRINLQKETYEGKAVDANNKPIKKYETIKTLEIYNRGVKQTDNKNGVLTSKFDSMDNLMRSIKKRAERLFAEGIHKTPTQRKALRKEAELKTAKNTVRKKGTALRWTWNKNKQQQNQINRYKEKTNRITEAAVDLKLENQFIRKAKSDGINYPKEYATLFNILRRDGKSINEAYAITKSYYDESQVVNNAIDNSIQILKDLRRRSIYNKLPKELKAKIDEYNKIWVGSRQQSDLTLAKRILNSATARELLGRVALTKSVKNQIMSEEGYGFENGKGTVSLQELFKGSKEIAQAFEQNLEDLRREVADFQARDMLGERTKKLTDTIIEIQDAVNSELEKQSKLKVKQFIKGFTNKTLANSQMTLKTEIQALMGGNIHSPMMVIHDNLQKAELRKKQAVVEIYRILNDFMTSSSGLNKVMGVEKWSKSLEKSLSTKSDWVDTGMSVPTKSGKNIDLRLPRSMIMSLAMHLQNDDNMLHISGGAVNITTDENGKTKIVPGKGEGVRIPNEELYKKGRIKDAYDTGKTVKLLHEQVEVLVDMLTDEEKAFVAATKKVFEYTTELINEVSNRIFGYDLATVENYFPIRVWDAGDSAGATMNSPVEKRYGEAVAYMLSPGWLQERVTAFNPIYLENIAEVLNRTVNNVANFYGYVEALRDNHIILDSRMPDGTELKKSIGELSSSFMKDYTRLTRFITGQERQEGNFARSLMAMNTLTFNVGTWLTQPMSFFNSLKYFSGKEFMQSINPVNNNLKLNQMIRNYFDDIGIDHTQYNDYQVARAFIAMATANLDYRALGYKIPQLNELFNTGIMNKLNNSVHGISAFDNIAVTAIARMMAYSVSLDPNIEFGSEEYFEVLGDRLTQVLVETQPEFSQVNRANMFRSKNGIMRTLSLFGTPANQMFNNVLQSAMQLRYEAREGNIQKSTVNNMIKSVVGVAVSSAMVAAVRAIRDSIRGGDDDDTEFKDRYIAQLIIALLGPTLILDDAAQFAMATAKYGGINSYDFSTPETAILNGIQNLGTKLAQLGDPEVSPTKKVVDVVKAAGSITPIDTRSIVRAIEGFMKLVLPDTFSSYALQKDKNAYKKWLESSDSDTAKFYKAYTNTRESVLKDKYGYHKADKDAKVKSNLKESRKAALEDVLDNPSDVKKYMEILFGYKD